MLPLLLALLSAAPPPAGAPTAPKVSAAPAAPAPTAPAPTATATSPAADLNVETICRSDDDCFLKVTKGEGAGRQVAVTTFRANRVGADMKYFKGEVDGAVDNADGGLMYLDRSVAVDKFGSLRVATPEDAPDTVLTFTMNTGIDPKGHVTFFCGYLHRVGDPLVHRAYLWGYPPRTVETIGSIGGPRSPTVPRKLPPLRPIEGGVQLSLLMNGDPDNNCLVTTVITRGDRQGQASTFFRANRLGEDMRYFPAEKKDGTELLGGSATFALDLHVVVGPRGALRPAEVDDDAAAVETLSAIAALDERGYVTFFYGFIRAPGTSYVQKFYLWGYPPETLVVEDAAGDDAARREGKHRGRS